MQERYFVVESQDIGTKTLELSLYDLKSQQTLIGVDLCNPDHNFYNVYWHTQISPVEFLSSIEEFTQAMEHLGINPPRDELRGHGLLFAIDGNDYVNATRPFSLDNLPSKAYRDGKLEFFGVHTPYAVFTYTDREWDHRAGRLREMRDADQPLIRIQARLQFPEQLAQFIQGNGREYVSLAEISAVLSRIDTKIAA